MPNTREQVAGTCNMEDIIEFARTKICFDMLQGKFGVTYSLGVN